eukprot:gene3430-4310_t
MAKKAGINKLKKELKSFTEAPPPYIPAVSVNEANILEWHFLLQGPPDTPYVGGWYIGKLKFPDDYPFKPPGIMMLTPNGRFKTGERLCLSMSDFHPELWNPMWSVANVLTGLLSFMCEDTPTTGSIETSAEQKKNFAHESLAFNLKNSKYFMMFPDLPAMAAAANCAAPTEVPPTAPTRQPIAVVDGVAITPAGRGEEQVAAASSAEVTETSSCARAQTQMDAESARAVEAAEGELRDGDPEGAQSRVTRALKKDCCSAAKLALLRLKAHTQAALGDLDSATSTLTEASE